MLMSVRSYKKLDQLTTLRFIAAWMIVIHHCAGMFGFSPDLTRPFIFGQGVSFFFVLSGFILTYVYPKLNTYQEVLDFLHARFARIWPVHAATFLLAFWMLSLGWAWKPALANLLLVHAWIPISSFFYSYNAPSWSISTEFFFYLAFPFMIHRWEKNWWIKMLLSAGILIALISYANLARLPGNGGALVYINPVSRIFEFIYGIFIASIWRKNSDKLHWNMAKATVMEVSAIFLCILSMHYTFSLEMWAAVSWPGPAFAQWLEGSGSMFVFGLLIYVMAAGRGLVSKLFSHSFLVLLGEISFSVYLVHQILLRYYKINLPSFPNLPNLLAFSLFSLILLLFSYLMWTWFEMPARRFILRNRKTPGKESRVKTLRGQMIQHRNAMSAAILLCCLVLSLYLATKNTDHLPITIDSLIASTIRGRTETVKSLINAGVPVNSRDSLGSTPLIHASWAGRQDIVQFLIDKNVDVNAFSSNSLTALLAAVFQKHEAIALMLLQHGANPNAVDAKGTSPLIEAAWQGNLNLIIALIARGADVNYMRPSDGLTALAAAKAAHQKQAIQFLMADGGKI